MFVGEGTNAGAVVDVEFSHQALGVLGPDAIKGLKCALRDEKVRFSGKEWVEMVGGRLP